MNIYIIELLKMDSIGLLLDAISQIIFTIIGLILTIVSIIIPLSKKKTKIVFGLIGLLLAVLGFCFLEISALEIINNAVEVPDVVGDPVETAIAHIESKNLKVSITEYHMTDSFVIGQWPEAGKYLNPGDQIKLDIKIVDEFSDFENMADDHELQNENVKDTINNETEYLPTFSESNSENVSIIDLPIEFCLEIPFDYKGTRNYFDHFINYYEFTKNENDSFSAKFEKFGFSDTRLEIYAWGDEESQYTDQINLSYYGKSKDTIGLQDIVDLYTRYVIYLDNELGENIEQDIMMDDKVVFNDKYWAADDRVIKIEVYISDNDDIEALHIYVYAKTSFINYMQNSTKKEKDQILDLLGLQ